VGGFQLQGIEQAEGVRRHIIQSVGRVRRLPGHQSGCQLAHVRRAEMTELLRQPRIPVVETDHEVFPVGQQPAELVPPVNHLGTQAHHQQQRAGLPGAEGVVLDTDSIGGQPGHLEPLESGEALDSHE
jgi:hypothetical protein